MDSLSFKGKKTSFAVGGRLKRKKTQLPTIKRKKKRKIQGVVINRNYRKRKETRRRRRDARRRKGNKVSSFSIREGKKEKGGETRFLLLYEKGEEMD